MPNEQDMINELRGSSTPGPVLNQETKTQVRISESTFAKLCRVAEAEEPTEPLFPNEAAEIVAEIRYLTLHLTAETLANGVLGALNRESETARIIRLGREEWERLPFEEKQRRTKEALEAERLAKGKKHA